MGPRSRRLRVCWLPAGLVSDRQSGPVQPFRTKALVVIMGFNQLQRYIVGHATICCIFSRWTKSSVLCLPRRSPETAGRRRVLLISHFCSICA